MDRDDERDDVEEVADTEEAEDTVNVETVGGGAPADAVTGRLLT